MYLNANRSKSLVPVKQQPSVPLSQIPQKNVRKVNSLREKFQENVENINDHNFKNRDISKSKPNKNYQVYQAYQNDKIKGQQQLKDRGLIYFDGNLNGQNISISNKRIKTVSEINYHNSNILNDFDEFNDFNLIQKKLNIYEMSSILNNDISKKHKNGNNLKAVHSLENTLSTNDLLFEGLNSIQSGKNSKNKIENKIDLQFKKDEKYISIKETIAAYKKEEQKISMKNNENNGRPPLSISNKLQIQGFANVNKIQSQCQLLKQVHSEERLNIDGQSCQQNSNNQSERKQFNNINRLNSNMNLCNNACSKNIQNENKENSSQNSTNSGTTVFNQLMNPSIPLPPFKQNNINVFRIKKQNFNRNNFNQNNQPLSLNFIPQTNSLQQDAYYDSVKCHSLSKIIQNQRICLENQEQEDNDKLNIGGEIPSNYISNQNINLIQGPNKQNWQKKKTSIEVQISSASNQEINPTESNISKQTCSSRFTLQNEQNNEQRYLDNKNRNTAFSVDNIQNVNQQKKQSYKRYSQKISANFLYSKQTYWSPDTTTIQQDDDDNDQINITKRSQSGYQRTQKSHNSQDFSNKTDFHEFNLTRQNNFSKQNKQIYNPELLKMINCSEIKPIYRRQSTIDYTRDDYMRNILVIKSDNLLFGGVTNQTYWEKKDNTNNNFNGGSNNFIGLTNQNQYNLYSNSNHASGGIGNSNNIGENYGNKLNEIKRIFKTLSKYYLIFLLFNNQSKKVRDLISFMIKTNFNFDGAYQIYSTQKNCGIYSTKSVNLQQIIIDFKIENINKVVIFDAVPFNFQININQNQKRNSNKTPTNSTNQKKKILSNQTTKIHSDIINLDYDCNIQVNKDIDEQESEENNEPEQSNSKLYKLKQEQHFDFLQNFIPKFEDAILEKTKVILFKQRSNPNLLQANQKKVMDVALQLVDSKIKSSTNNLRFIDLDISEITAKSYEEGVLQHRKRLFLKQISKLKKQNKDTKEIIELDADKVSEVFRTKLIEYMKSTQKQIHNLYYLVCDLISRNHPFHCKKKNFDNLLLLNLLRYESFPQLVDQVLFKGKQVQQQFKKMKEITQQNPYDIMFLDDDSNQFDQKCINDQSSTNNDLNTTECEAYAQELRQQQIESKKKQISTFLPFKIHLCTDM